ncbi:RagB/SusD family nutrient uptake outer membrane protein [Dyadobacter chenwenxiniae]|uniref:RagB/SusD family nutrient uptake outer membrane protein n=1 Tax=Dyadobacter chenwenxiniae TaxID=2906456 RepID=A0A9X1PHA2_9BACT|nr:RagB/SusD family nutrient uptake outer membrane protein [Dyadobacter chenwenxiniae]MCF0060743.1 RagB/SusD family nutrient uptake outer membrane protein [Dyadobacter chenwenxiniae]UON80577.1 RagB/SusD family nutrient uptake outer membrane protein [Dyadobacter chenwenxiniae]
MGTRATSGSCWTNGIPSPTLVDMYENLDGSPFDWNKVIPGFSAMTTDQESALFSDSTKVQKAYQNRDLRLQASVIIPYAKYTGASNVVYTLGWPYKGSAAPFRHIQNNWNANAIYVWRKFVSVGDESLLRENGPIDFAVIRLADVLLMYAEARTQHLAAEGLSYSLSADGRSLAQANNSPILEFTGRTLKTRRFQTRDYLWPIPQAEIDQNNLLPQNPGWE